MPANASTVASTRKSALTAGRVEAVGASSLGTLQLSEGILEERQFTALKFIGDGVFFQRFDSSEEVAAFAAAVFRLSTLSSTARTSILEASRRNRSRASVV
jgi:hypothetical protein